jgi:hypothetical protein
MKELAENQQFKVVIKTRNWYNALWEPVVKSKTQQLFDVWEILIKGIYILYPYSLVSDSFQKERTSPVPALILSNKRYQ